MPLLPRSPYTPPRQQRFDPFGRNQQLTPSPTGQGFPRPPQYNPANTSALDQQIRELMQRMGGQQFQPGQFQYQEDPRYGNLISQLQGQQGQYQNQMGALEQRLQQIGQQTYTPRPISLPKTFDPNKEFTFGGGSENQLRDTISKLMQGKGVGPIDVQSDPAAAAYRVARERQAQAERSALAERMGATGDIMTGGGDVALLGTGREAGREIAGYEANLANQRRGEILQQMLSGAQLGLQNIEGRRGAELQAFQRTQANRLSYDQQAAQIAQQNEANRLGAFQTNQTNMLAALQGRMGALGGADPTSSLMQALQQSQGARGQAFGEFQGGESERFGAFESDIAGQNRMLAQLNAQRQAATAQGQQAFENQMAEYNAAEARRAQLEREKTGKTERELLEEELKERKKKNKGPGGGLPVPGMGTRPFNTPWNPFKRS